MSYSSYSKYLNRKSARINCCCATGPRGHTGPTGSTAPTGPTGNTGWTGPTAGADNFTFGLTIYDNVIQGSTMQPPTPSETYWLVPGSDVVPANGTPSLVTNYQIGGGVAGQPVIPPSIPIAYQFPQKITHVAVHLSLPGATALGITGWGPGVNFTAFAYCDVDNQGLPVAGQTAAFTATSTCQCIDLDSPLDVGCGVAPQFLAVHFTVDPENPNEPSTILPTVPKHIGVTFYCEGDLDPPVP